MDEPAHKGRNRIERGGKLEDVMVSLFNDTPIYDCEPSLDSTIFFNETKNKNTISK